MSILWNTSRFASATTETFRESSRLTHFALPPIHFFAFAFSICVCIWLNFASSGPPPCRVAFETANLISFLPTSLLKFSNTENLVSKWKENAPMNLTGGGPYAKMIARAWADEKFMNLLRSKPKHAMAEMGIDVPEGVDIVVVEDTPQKVHVVVREKPSRNEMSDQDLNKLTWAYESNSGPSGGSRMATCD